MGFIKVTGRNGSLMHRVVMKYEDFQKLKVLLMFPLPVMQQLTGATNDA